jgi:hypothetical protein
VSFDSHRRFFRKNPILRQAGLSVAIFIFAVRNSIPWVERWQKHRRFSGDLDSRTLNWAARRGMLLLKGNTQGRTP